MERLLLRPVEAAEVLGLSRSRLYELLARREIPAVRIGHSLLIPADALREWVSTRERVTASGTR